MTFKRLNITITIIALIEQIMILLLHYTDGNKIGFAISIISVLIITYSLSVETKASWEVVTELIFLSQLLSIGAMLILHGLGTGIFLKLVTLYIISSMYRYQLKRNKYADIEEVIKEAFIIIAILILTIMQMKPLAFVYNFIFTVSSLLSVAVLLNYIIRAAVNGENFFKKKSGVDALTGQPNRNMLLERIEEWKRVGKGIGVVAILDIDFFKRVNDTYGHDAGDCALREIVSSELNRIISSSYRTDTFTARWGGEEFLIIFSKNYPKSPADVLEELRQSIEDKTVIVKKPNGMEIDLSVTVSIGAVYCNDRDSFDEYVKYADENLYHAKESGRNIVVWG